MHVPPPSGVVKLVSAGAYAPNTAPASGRLVAWSVLLIVTGMVAYGLVTSIVADEPFGIVTAHGPVMTALAEPLTTAVAPTFVSPDPAGGVSDTV